MGDADHVAGGGPGRIDPAGSTAVSQTTLPGMAIRPVALARGPVVDPSPAAKRAQHLQPGEDRALTHAPGSRVVAFEVADVTKPRGRGKQPCRAQYGRCATIPAAHWTGWFAGR